MKNLLFKTYREKKTKNKKKARTRERQNIIFSRKFSYIAKIVEK
jgi:hypothetical protein